MSGRPDPRRWGIIGLVAAATVVNYIDRGTVAVMWPGIARDLSLTKTEYAAIVSCFMVAYGISQTLSGRLYDRIGTRLGFIVSVAVWSVSEAAHALVGGLAGFGAVRALLGLGEAGNWPGATKAVAEWFPADERALGQGWFNAGAALGAIISAPLIALLYAALGWRLTFAVVGLAGLLWIVPWALAYPRSSHAPAPHAATGEPARPWREILRQRESWSVIVSRFFIDPIWWLFVSWLPLYLAERFHFDVKAIGLFAWVPYVGAGAGSLLGGAASGRLIRRGWPVVAARRAVIAAGGVLMIAGLVAVAFAATPLSAVLLIAAVLFGFQVSINNIQTLPGDFFTGGSVGLLAGLGGTSATVGVLLITWLVPLLTATSYAPVFLLAALAVPVGVASVYLFTPKAGRSVAEAR
jgi:ACS family hexuronate transporter-like MFS transporter